MKIFYRSPQYGYILYMAHNVAKIMCILIKVLLYACFTNVCNADTWRESFAYGIEICKSNIECTAIFALITEVCYSQYKIFV